MFRKPWFWAVFTLVSALCTIWAVKPFRGGLSHRYPRCDDGSRRPPSRRRKISPAIAVGVPTTRVRPSSSPSTAKSRALSSSRPAANPPTPRCLAGDLYSPYTWVVRRFAEGEVNEATLRFGPDGRPYGFREKDAGGRARGESRRRCCSGARGGCSRRWLGCGPRRV